MGKNGLKEDTTSQMSNPSNGNPSIFGFIPALRTKVGNQSTAWMRPRDTVPRDEVGSSGLFTNPIAVGGL